MPLVDRFNYREHESRFQAACKWMRDKGIAIDGTRVGYYQGILAEVADYYERGAINELITLRGIPWLLNALTESKDFVDIHSGLSRAADQDMFPKLKQFCRGAEMLRDETTAANQNQPRNMGFELLIAAAAASCGVNVSLQPPADLSLVGPNQSYFVECKRPFTEKRLARRIREGLEQLQRRYSSSASPEEARGILAVSVSRIVNHGSLMLKVSNEANVAAEMDRIFSLLIPQYEHCWSTADQRTVAILLELRTACQLTDLPLLITLCHHVFVTLCDHNPVDRKQLYELLRKFAARAQPPQGGRQSGRRDPWSNRLTGNASQRFLDKRPGP
jgi:hypothetical protein